MSSVSGITAMDNNLNNANNGLQHSKLFRTLNQITAINPAENNPVQFYLSDIINLLHKIAPSGVTYEELKCLSHAGLTPQESKILSYIQHSPYAFQRLTGLSGEKDTLSSENLKAINKPEGYFAILTNGEIRYIRGKQPANLPEQLPDHPQDTAKPNILPKQNPEALPDTQQGIEHLTGLFNKINPNGLTFEALQQYPLPQNDKANPFTPEELRLLHLLQSPEIRQPITQVLQRNDGQLTPEVIRLLSSLIWNPAAFYSHVPVVFYTPPPSTVDLPSVEPIHSVSALHPTADVYTRVTVRPPEATQEIELSAVKLHTILHKINPNGRVTLKQLQKYVPSTPEERKTLNALKNQNVFKVLANLDGRQDTLDDDDIEIMASKKVIYLSDAHLMLVIHE